MPAKNVVKIYAPEGYYHIYNRGVAKQDIFRDDQDYGYFVALLKRYLSAKAEKNTNYRSYKGLNNDLDLVAYCLMSNHFHLLIYEKTGEGMPALMKKLGVSYSMYFNKRYQRTGALFQQRYRAVRIERDAHLEHITRYVHMNPRDYRHWRWSSLGDYIGERRSDWLKPLILSEGDYLNFLKAYEDRKDELTALKKELAG